MGIIKSSFSFIVGTVCGIYIAQNYSVPNIKKLVDTAFFTAKHVEEKYRKPKNRDDDFEEPIESTGNEYNRSPKALSYSDICSFHSLRNDNLPLTWLQIKTGFA
ncbi:hypothetical protein CRYUN_Cryun12cG0190800 [Craigia yunnanensis]